jgi:hypothetical protein
MFHGTVPIYKVFDTKGKEVNHIIGKISGIIENGSHV